MDYTFTKDQEMIKKSAKEFFVKECPKERVRELKEDPRAYDPKMWQKMVELGFQGLMIPEEFGGMQGDFMELMIFMEEMGRNIVPCPFFTTVVECALPLLEFGTDSQKKNFLPGIAEKGAIWSLAQAEQAADLDAADINLAAEADGGDFVLSGTKLFVPYATEADYLSWRRARMAPENPRRASPYLSWKPKQTASISRPCPPRPGTAALK